VVKTTRKYLGICGVDSGQLFIVDPCYVFSDNFVSDSEPTGEPYDSICRATLAAQQGTEVLGGVAFNPGFGDGVYPVYAEIEPDGTVARVVIECMGEDDVIECMGEDDE